MGSYLNYIQQGVNRVPVESLSNLIISGMHDRNLLEDLSPVTFTTFNDKSIDTVIQMTLRAVSAHFIFPRVSPVLAIINGAIGGVHLGIGVIQRFKTQEKDWIEQRDLIETHLRKGVAHLVTGVYDFAVGYVLKQKHVGLLGAAVFAIAPTIVKVYHEKMYKKPEVKKEEKPEPQATAEVVVDEVKKALDIVPPKITKVDYLDPSCLIYRIADRFTFEIMPEVEVEKPEEPKSLVGRFTGTLRRLTGFDAPAKAPTVESPVQSTSEGHPE